MEKPKDFEEMTDYMRAIGLCEGIDFLEIIIKNGWAENEEEAEKYLEEIKVYPNSYYELCGDNESYQDWKLRMSKCESEYCIDCGYYFGSGSSLDCVLLFCTSEIYEKAYQKIKEYYEIVQRDDALTVNHLYEFMDEEPFTNISDKNYENLITAVIRKIKRGNNYEK